MTKEKGNIHSSSFSQ